MIREPPVGRVRLDAITPAPYNPRRISDAQFAELRRSLRTVGCVVPILVNRRNGVIVAGHQRARAMLAEGIAEAPAFLIDGLNPGDEMKFNQLHNGTEARADGTSCAVPPGTPCGAFTRIPARAFTVPRVPACTVKETCRLIMTYGNVFSAVVCGGMAFLGHAYARACSLLRIGVNAYVADPSLAADIARFFGQDYGEYCYDGIERHTYVQGLAQMNRAVEAGGGKTSRLYLRMVQPWLARQPGGGKGLSILDFGCGKGAYVRHLRETGFASAIGLEFYNHNGVSVSAAAGNAQIDALLRHVRERGLFDVVVCDSVVNSVDSMEAEVAVLRCLNLLWSGKGACFVSGRTRVHAERDQRKMRDTAQKQFIRFLDRDGFTAQYRRGSWFFQHYHTRDSLTRSLDAAGLAVEEWDEDGCAFRARLSRARVPDAVETRSAVAFEFNLPLPGGMSYNRHIDALSALGKAGVKC